ncbi:MAG: hypothetical protein H7222_13275 [Methylotenera sp.]|nr:hypothetical protein [Oligoflexia bacterium]
MKLSFNSPSWPTLRVSPQRGKWRGLVLIGAAFGALCTCVAPSLNVQAAPRAQTAKAQTLQADEVHTAEGKKSQIYVQEGLFVGGDRAIDRVVIKDIRRAANPAGYDRIVIDLEGNRNGEPAAVQRPPYFQVAVKADQRRINFSIWGNPQLQFDSRKVVAAFKKSAVVERVDLYPKMEEDFWTFSVLLKADSPVEVFELTQPVRIIVDVRSAPKKEK